LNIDIAFKVLGWEDTFKHYPNVRLLNLTKDERTEVNLNGLFFKNLKMSKKYMESDLLISVAKLKTHTMTGITCNLKNLFGANPIKYKAQYHPHLDEAIFDLNKARMPDTMFSGWNHCDGRSGARERRAKPHRIIDRGK
jgi:uncharacterized protein (DUF362 family)